MKTKRFDCPTCGGGMDVQITPPPKNGIVPCAHCGDLFEISDSDAQPEGDR